MVDRTSQEMVATVDPNSMVRAAQRGLPPELGKVLAEYGFERSEMAMTLKSSAEYQRSMMDYLQHKDLVKLGRQLAELIQRTEFAVSEGLYQMGGGQGIRSSDFGIPFNYWMESLPLCAEALRSLKGASAADLDAADVLELKFLISRRRHNEAFALTSRAIARNPKLGYAYYMSSMRAEHEEGLRAAKKGLTCPGLTPFVRNYLLWRAVEHAGDLGIVGIAEAGQSEEKRLRGLAFLDSALEDAQTFIAEAPPDNWHQQTMINWFILLTFAIRGDQLDDNLSQLAEARRKLAYNTRMLEYLQFSIPRNQLRLTRELLLDLFPKKCVEWFPMIERLDKIDPDGASYHHRPSTAARGDGGVASTDNGLEAWLEGLRLEDDPDDGHAMCRHPKISLSKVALYRCSYCRNPSAKLKRCSGCGKTRLVSHHRNERRLRSIFSC